MKRKKEKVYCKECEFYEFVMNRITSDVVHCYEKCNHDNAVMGDYRERNAGRIEPEKRNENNGCADHKELKESQ